MICHCQWLQKCTFIVKTFSIPPHLFVTLTNFNTAFHLSLAYISCMHSMHRFTMTVPKNSTAEEKPMKLYKDWVLDLWYTAFLLWRWSTCIQTLILSLLYCLSQCHKIHQKEIWHKIPIYLREILSTWPPKNVDQTLWRIYIYVTSKVCAVNIIDSEWSSISENEPVQQYLS